MTTMKATIALCLLLCASFATAQQYQTNYTTSLTDLSGYSISGTNIWKKLNGGTCLGVSVSYDGVLYCINTGYGLSTFNPQTQSWTAQTAMGTGIYAVAVQDASNVWALRPSSSCDPLDYGLFKWNGSSWNPTTGCVVQFSLGGDGTLVATTYYQQIYKSIDGGQTWTMPWGAGTAWSYVSIATATSGCAIQGQYIYTLSSTGSFVLMPIAQQPWGGGTVIGCLNAQGGDPILMAWNTSGAVAMYDSTGGAWHVVTGLTISTHTARLNYLSARSKGRVIGVDATGQPYHWNTYAAGVNATITGTQTCPGGTCPQGAIHTGTVRAQFPHGVNGQTAMQQVSPTTNMNVDGWDASPSCDPMFGNPQDSECFINTSANVQCSAAGHSIFSGGYAVAFPYPHLEIARSRVIATSHVPAPQGQWAYTVVDHCDILDSDLDLSAPETMPPILQSTPNMTAFDVSADCYSWTGHKPWHCLDAGGAYIDKGWSTDPGLRSDCTSHP